MRKMMKRGFTLAEVLVTVAVVGVVAAIVVPAVIKQATAGDPLRVGHDLVSVKKGIEMFSQNVRPRMPGAIEHLLNEPTTSKLGADGTVYLDAHTDAWNGPYVQWTALSTLGVTATTEVMQSAVGARLINPLYRCPATGTYHDQIGDLPCTISTTPGTDNVDSAYLAVKVIGIPFDSDEYDRVNAIFDGDEGSGNERFNLGLVRQNQSGTVFFLAVPYSRP